MTKGKRATLIELPLAALPAILHQTADVFTELVAKTEDLQDDLWYSLDNYDLNIHESTHKNVTVIHVDLYPKNNTQKFIRLFNFIDSENPNNTGVIRDKRSFDNA